MRPKDLIIVAVAVAITSVMVDFSNELFFISMLLLFSPYVALIFIKGFALSKTTFLEKNSIFKMAGLSLLETIIGSLIWWNGGNPKTICIDVCSKIKDSSFMGSAMREQFAAALIVALIINTIALAFAKLLMRHAAKKAAQQIADQDVNPVPTAPESIKTNDELRAEIEEKVRREMIKKEVREKLTKEKGQSH